MFVRTESLLLNGNVRRQPNEEIVLIIELHSKLFVVDSMLQTSLFLQKKDAAEEDAGGGGGGGGGYCLFCSLSSATIGGIKATICQYNVNLIQLTLLIVF